MAELVRIGDATSGYRTILDTLLTKGHKQESRNGNTIEVEDLVIELEHPQLAVVGGARPGYNQAIGAVEGLQLIAGISDSSLTCEIQPNFRNFMDNGEFWGAYGPRTVGQFSVIADRLRADPDTRQAIVTLWDPKHDAHGGKKDHPCTTAFNFRMRDGRLNMTTFMRSNDVYWGWPYDVYQFAMLQLTMANVLGAEIGTYTHHAASFHIYEPHWDIAKEILDGPAPTLGAESIEGFVGRWAQRGGSPWDAAQREARDVWHVVRGVLPASVLQSQVQRRYASMLLERKLKVATQNLGKLNDEKSRFLE